MSTRLKKVIMGTRNSKVIPSADDKKAREHATVASSPKVFASKRNDDPLPKDMKQNRTMNNTRLQKGIIVTRSSTVTRSITAADKTGHASSLTSKEDEILPKEMHLQKKIIKQTPMVRQTLPKVIEEESSFTSSSPSSSSSEEDDDVDGPLPMVCSSSIAKSSLFPATAANNTATATGPYANSVILGRGREQMTHPGNQKLRALCMLHLEDYSNALTDKTSKSKVVSSVYEEIVDSCHIGGVPAFVKRNKKLPNNDLQPVSLTAAREKIGYTFRDILADRYKSSSKSKVAKLRAERAFNGGSKDSKTTLEEVKAKKTVKRKSATKDKVVKKSIAKKPTKKRYTKKISKAVSSNNDPLDWRDDPKMPLESVFDILSDGAGASSLDGNNTNNINTTHVRSGSVNSSSSSSSSSSVVDADLGQPTHHRHHYPVTPTIERKVNDLTALLSSPIVEVLNEEDMVDDANTTAISSPDAILRSSSAVPGTDNGVHDDDEDDDEDDGMFLPGITFHNSQQSEGIVQDNKQKPVPFDHVFVQIFGTTQKEEDDRGNKTPKTPKKPSEPSASSSPPTTANSRICAFFIR